MSKSAAELVFQNASIVHPTGVEVGDVAIAAGLIVGVGSGLTGKKLLMPPDCIYRQALLIFIHTCANPAKKKPKQ